MRKSTKIKKKFPDFRIFISLLFLSKKCTKIWRLFYIDFYFINFLIYMRDISFTFDI